MSSSSDESSSSDDEKPATKRQRRSYSSESEDERPKLGGFSGMMFNKSSTLTGGDTMNINNDNSNNATTSTEEPSPPQAATEHISTYGIGAKLMSKMGYKAGTGLGSGKGIVNPVEQKLRPTKLGLGGMNEKAGEQDEKKNKKKEKKRVQIVDEPEGIREQQRKKDVYKTMKEMEDEGLIFGSGVEKIIDMTGGYSKVGNTGDMMKGGILFDEKSQQLEQYVEKWESLREHYEYTEKELKRLEENVDNLNNQQSKLNGVLVDVENGLSMLELQGKYYNDIGSLQLDQIAVASIRLNFESNIKSWDPLHEPTKFKTEFSNLKVILRIDSPDSTYHKLINNVWLPYVQSYLITYWNPTVDPYSAVSLFQEWQPLLSKPTQDALFHRVIFPKLKSEIQNWKPLDGGASATSQDNAAQKPLGRDSQKQKPLHTWLFPWLPYLNDLHQELIEMVRTKFAAILRTANIQDPNQSTIIDNVKEWHDLVGEKSMNQLLESNLIPKLNDYLRRNFTINPANQNVDALDTLLKWQNCGLSNNTIGLILDQYFFPKLQNVLKQWLITKNNYTQLADWLNHWTFNYFPEVIIDTPVVAQNFRKVYDFVNKELDRYEREDRTPSTETNNATRARGVNQNTSQSTTQSLFEKLEDYCNDNGYILGPLREKMWGNQLYRVTASANGKGGLKAVVYNDKLYIQQNKTFVIVSLEELSNLLEY